jgi:hypothetical protein
MEFKDPANTACLVCLHVLDDRLPILFVSHDADDGGWQFLCDVHAHDENNVVVRALHNAVAMDPAVQQVADLPLGSFATRVSPDRPWYRQSS